MLNMTQYEDLYDSQYQYDESFLYNSTSTVAEEMLQLWDRPDLLEPMASGSTQGLSNKAIVSSSSFKIPSNYWNSTISNYWMPDSHLYFDDETEFTPKQQTSSKVKNSLFLPTVLALSSTVLEQVLPSFFDENSWYALMITTKKFSAVKKKTVYWKLNQHYSVQFYLNPVWRKRFLACIENPAEQVGLQLSQYLWISKSDASQCTNPTEGETPDVPQPSKEMQYLQSVNNVYWLDISNNPGLKDISMLTNVKKLFMSRCPDLVNISGASGSRKVDISNCPKIVDFSPLQGIKILRARHNPQIEDVTVFANILSVDLSFCSNIVDISPLSKVPVLTVMGCSKVMNFHTLIENEVLYLSQNRTLRYLPSITSKTVELNFDNCPNIEKIDDLWQGFLRGVDTSVPLQNNEKEIDEDSFSVPFRGIDGLQLDNAHNFKHSRGSELREISMVSCHGIKTISNFKLEHFPLLHTIRICRCMSSKEFCTKPLIREKFCYEHCSNKKRQLRGQQENNFPRFNI